MGVVHISYMSGGKEANVARGFAGDDVLDELRQSVWVALTLYPCSVTWILQAAVHLMDLHLLQYWLQKLFQLTSGGKGYLLRIIGLFALTTCFAN